ncbi:MAG: hypothetical protein ACYC7E_02700 [Armatimonadota bacterium]
MRRLMVLLSVLMVIQAAQATVSAARDTANPNLMTLKNALTTIVIDLANGAHVVSARYAGFSHEEIVRDVKSDNGGLFKDLWITQGWPGEFDKRLYEAEIVNAGPEEAVVKTWTMSTGMYRNQVQEDLKDFLLVKTFILRKDERMLTVRIDLTNQGEKGKRPAFWAQHALDFDGARKNNVYWRPTRHAVDWIDDVKRTSEYGYWYVAITNAGWNGVTNRALKRGVLFLMDYNDLQHVYDNTAATTIEWMYDDVAVPAGKTWTTVIKMIPTEGFATYTYGGEQVVAAVEATETPAGLRIGHTLTAAATPLKDVTVKTTVKGVRAPWTAEGAPFTLATLGLEPTTKMVDVSGLGPLPCVVEVTLTGADAAGKPVAVTYADYVGGKAGRNLDLATLEPLYQFPIPEKKKQYLKPNVIKLQHPKPAKILFIRGLWAEFHGIDEAMKRLGEVTVVNGWMKKGALGETLGGFPAAYEDLLSYDVIILGNVSGAMLSDVGQEMLADFLKAGGGVLMLSGDRTYGQTTFGNANFAKQLPFSTTPGDYGRLTVPLALKAGARHDVLKGVTFGANDVVLYTHRLRPGEGAVVPVTLADGTPALILSSEKTPRVAVVAVLPFGKASDGKTLYFQNAGWQALMANTLDWLLGRR